MTTLLQFIRLLLTKRRLIISMAVREVRAQYVGSSLGLLWTLVHPIVMITVFWFVFSVGFKARPMNDVPFVVWLTAGLAPWYIFSEIISGSTSIIVAHAHLVKKTIFFPQILPIVKILSSLVTHSVFLVVLLALLASQKMDFSLYYFQALYYLFCLLVLSLGISWSPVFTTAGASRLITSDEDTPPELIANRNAMQTPAGTRPYNQFGRQMMPGQMISIGAR